MRVIIRFSLNRDKKSGLRNVLKPTLESHGIMWTGKMTGTYEGNVSENDIRNALRQFWQVAANVVGSAHIDHFWMYADNSIAAQDDADDA